MAAQTASMKSGVGAGASATLREEPARMLNPEGVTPWRPPLAKIVATVGPSVAHPYVLQKVIESGARIFRLNFSHGTFEEHLTRLRIIRMVSEQMGVPVAVMGDLSGPKIRCRRVPEPGIVLKPGQDVEIRADMDECRDGEVPVLAATYPNVATEVRPGHRLLIDDGKVRMLCMEVREGVSAMCRVTTGGLVTTGKGINMPDSDLTVPALTEKDWACVAWAVEQELDYLAMSFVRRGSDVRALREHLERVCTLEVCGTGLEGVEAKAKIPLIAKIETPQAVTNIEEIIVEADGIMVARGDLGVEMDIATVPISQKLLVRTAHEHGKPCIVATQMLESMVNSQTATRAEVSDVANAILDGADAVMLSAETAVGRFPHLAVETMRRVALATERALRERHSSPRPPRHAQQLRELVPALAHGAWHIAMDINAQLIVVWSQRGGGARYLSRNGFDVPILAYSSDKRAVRRMALLYGVYPIYEPNPPEHRSEFGHMVDRLVTEQRLVEHGAPMILLGGKPFEKPGSLNTLAVRYAGELSDGAQGRG